MHRDVQTVPSARLRPESLGLKTQGMFANRNRLLGHLSRTLLHGVGYVIGPKIFMDLNCLPLCQSSLGKRLLPNRWAIRDWLIDPI